MKVMDWDYHRKSVHFPTEESYDLEGSGVWIDSEGIPSEETLSTTTIGTSSTSTLAGAGVGIGVETGLSSSPPNKNYHASGSDKKFEKHRHENDEDGNVGEEEGEENEKIGLLGENEELEIITSPINVDSIENNESTISFEVINPIEPYDLNNITVHDHNSPSVKDLLDLYIFPSQSTISIPPTSSHSQQVTNELLHQQHFSELCRRCFTEKDAREIFLQTLDEKRGRNALLTKEQYDKMKVAMKVLVQQKILFLFYF